MDEDFNDAISLADYPGYILYSTGDIYSRKMNRYLRPSPRGGYLFVKVYHKDGVRDSVSLHQLIGRAFLGNPDDLPIVNHKDGNGLNDDVHNLEWIDHRGNILHAIRTGLTKLYTRPVIQCSLTGDTIQRFESIIQASIYMECDPKKIGRVCRKKRKSFYGFGWKYETEKVFDEREGEEWKDIVDHPDYSISTQGRIYSEKTKRLLKSHIRRDGYERIGIDRNLYYVQCLMGYTFLGPPDPSIIKPVVNHKDKDKQNNHLSNLEWISFQGNVQHSYDTGENGWQKPVIQYSLEGEEIQRFRSMKKASEAVGGTNLSAISKVCSKVVNYNTAAGFVWRFVDEPLQPGEIKKYVKEKICQYTLSGELVATWRGFSEAGRSTGIHYNSIRQACDRKSKTAGEFVWRYEKDGPPEGPTRRFKKRVARYELDGTFIDEWDSITEAAKAINFKSQSKITMVCKGKRKTAGGFIWKLI